MMNKQKVLIIAGLAGAILIIAFSAMEPSKGLTPIFQSGGQGGKVLVEMGAEKKRLLNVEGFSTQGAMSARHRSFIEAELELSEEEQAYRYKDYQEWQRSRGYFSNTEKEGYASYDIGVLQTLAGQGDMLAAQLLAIKFLERGDAQKARDAELLAAMHGSTKAIINLGMFVAVADLSGVSIGESGQLSAAIGAPIDRTKVMEKLAFYQAAAMRGDTGAIEIGVADLKRYGVTLSKAESEIVEGWAKKLYVSIEDARLRSHLGPLDNSEDPYARALALFKLDGFDNDTGWGGQYY